MAEPHDRPAADPPDHHREVRQAYRAAVRAGPLPTPLRPLTDEELDAPIEPARPPAAAAEVARPVDRPAADATTLAAAGGAGGWLAAEAPAVPDAPGYACGALLSAGGQASVFAAVHEATGLRVALKVLHGGPYLTAAARRRLDREVRALASVAHPNVARVVDRGRTTDGSFFVATQLIDGRPLDARAAEIRAAQDGPALLALFAKVAAGVAAAHAAGVVHRDVKPSNVLVDAAGEPHLIDFGLARLLDPGGLPGGGGRYATVTSTGQILGSLPWASPEQADGRSAAVGPPADAYAIGVMLYHALTGRFPYDVEGPVYEVIDAIRRTAPPPPSRAAVPWAGIDPAAVDAVVLRALAKDARDRYASARDLHADLARLASGLSPATAGPRSRPRHFYAPGPVARALAGFRGPHRVRPAVLWVSAATAVLAGVLAVPTAPPPARAIVPLALPSATAPHGIRFVRVPAGEFRMGSRSAEEGRDPAEVQRVVRVPRPLWLSVTEVTRGQYRAVTRNDPAAPTAPEADLPATGVTHAEAEAFCRLLGALDGHAYRLPDEAEWEYACRGATVGPYAGTAALESMGWYLGNRGPAAGPSPVARKQPNAYGLYDMHGNAREWCRDRHVPGYGPPRRPTETYHPVARGGSYARPAAECRSAARGWAVADVPEPDVGFRVVREDPGPAATTAPAPPPP